MKVTAFIRKTAAKNNITDQARVYFRVRDIGGVDIKAASELSINPNHWSPERQGYKPRVALVSEEKKMAFDKDVQQITHLITKEYHRGVDGNWFKSLIEEYHHPNINARGGNKADEYLLSYQIRKYIEETPLADESRKHHLDNLNKVLRYERFRHEVLHQRGNTARGRKPQAPPRQSQQGAALRAFPPRGAASAGLSPLHRYHNG